MNNLFIVQSPFQLLGAIEAKSHFSSDDNSLIIRYSSGPNDLQMSKLAKLSHWDKVTEIRPFLHPKIGNIQLLIILSKYKKLKKKFDRVFIGEYRSQPMHCFFDTLSPEECYLLDDGNITIDIQKNYLPLALEAYYSKGIKSKLVKAFHSSAAFILGISPNRNKREINLFTCFNLTPHSNSQKVIVHAFPFLKTQAKLKQRLDDTVIFFGGNLSDLGIISEENEFSLLLKIKEYYKKQGIKVVYAPHRKEGEEKLLAIQNRLNIEIRKFSNPAELEFIYMTEHPHGIASFFSTALYTVSKIFDFSSVHPFRIPTDMVIPSYQQEMVETYDEYSKYFKVINLNEIG